MYEYQVIPAPIRGERAKGLKTPADRYALALQNEINRLAADGWEYQRAETLPSEEGGRLSGRNTVYNNVLVFRRVVRPSGEASTVQVDTKASEAPKPANTVTAAE